MSERELRKRLYDLILDLEQGDEEAINDIQGFLYRDLGRVIEREFHVRLTDDGWEWTE